MITLIISVESDSSEEKRCGFNVFNGSFIFTCHSFNAKEVLKESLSCFTSLFMMPTKKNKCEVWAGIMRIQKQTYNFLYLMEGNTPCSLTYHLQ